MVKRFFPSPWKPSKKDSGWVIVASDGTIIAQLEGSANNAKTAHLIAASPYMLDSLKAVQKLAGGNDLPDNGEWSGAAITDQVSAAVGLAEGKIKV